MNGDAGPECAVPIDDLLDQAGAAINRGDRVAGTALGEQVLAVDGVNAEAEDLLATPADPGQIRRLTILFADLVDSTVLSTRVEPETYRMLVGRYREQVVATVNRFEGYVGSKQGDGPSEQAFRSRDGFTIDHCSRSRLSRRGSKLRPPSRAACR